MTILSFLSKLLEFIFRKSDPHVKSKSSIKTTDNNLLDSSINSVFISPGKRPQKTENRFVKIKEKILKGINDSTLIQDESSFSHTYRSSMIPGEVQVTITSLVTDSEGDEE